MKGFSHLISLSQDPNRELGEKAQYLLNEFYDENENQEINFN